MTAALAHSFDLRHLSDAFYDDPYPSFHALREHAPVKRMPDGSVLLTRYADVIAVYKDPKTFSSDKHEGLAEAAARSAVRSIGSSVGREIIRGVLGSILGGGRRR